LTNFAIGTPGFAPPEQMAMRPVYSSDLYAFAMSCLYLLTGRSPKDFGHDPYTGQINWRSQIQVSAHLTALFDRMLQPTVTQRFRTAAEVLQALSGGDSSPTATSTASGSATSAPAPISSYISVGSPQNRVAPLPNSRIQAARNLAGSGNTQFNVDSTQGYTKFGKDLRGGRKVIAEYSHGKRNFASLDLAKASLASATLTGIVLSRSKLTETDFCQANLVGASFQGSIMTQAKLNGANLSQAKMQRAILTKADLGGACLAQADLREATLQFAYLSKADLTGANLSGANLKGAYLSQANLRGANLCGADLKGAKVTDEQLATAKTNWSTIRPDGSKRLF
jgi:serine/threonine protein kinase, bacterial